MNCPNCGHSEYETIRWEDDRSEYGYPAYKCEDCGEEWAEPAH